MVYINDVTDSSLVMESVIHRVHKYGETADESSLFDRLYKLWAWR